MVHKEVQAAHKEAHPVEEVHKEDQVALMEVLVVLEALDMAHKLVMEVHKEDLEALVVNKEEIEEEPNNMVLV